MNLKRLSLLLALVVVFAFCFVGCDASSQEPEAFIVSIYKVEKEQDEDGNVYITDYDLWKSYSVTTTQSIDLPDYDSEKTDKDCKVSYKSNYNSYAYISETYIPISGRISGELLRCKNKVQFIPSANSTIFARERERKTINFFYEGKNVIEYLDVTQRNTLYNATTDTYNETFSSSLLEGLFTTFFAKYTSLNRIKVTFYTKVNSEKPFEVWEVVNDDGHNRGIYYSYSQNLTLIKSTDVYLKIEKA